LNESLTCSEIGDEAIIERYVAGTLSSELIDRFEIHLLDCDTCQMEVRLAWAVREALGPAHAPGVSDRDARVIPMRHRRRFTRVAAAAGVAAAAAAVLLFAVPSLRMGDPSTADDSHRAPSSETRSTLIPVAPVGAVNEVEQIRWTSALLADRYRLTLLDQDGSITWEHETADTFVALPTGVRLEDGADYYWTVEARVGFDRWVASEMAVFRVTPHDTRRR